MITAENKVFIGLSVIIKNVYLVGESNFRLSNFWLVKGDSPPISPVEKTLSYNTYMHGRSAKISNQFHGTWKFRFKTVFYKLTPTKEVVNEEVLANSGTSANLNKNSNTYISLCNSPLGQHLAENGHFSIYFYRKQIYIHKTIYAILYFNKDLSVVKWVLSHI